LWLESYPGPIPKAVLSALSVNDRIERWARSLGEASTHAAATND